MPRRFGILLIPQGPKVGEKKKMQRTAEPQRPRPPCPGPPLGTHHATQQALGILYIVMGLSPVSFGCVWGENWVAKGAACLSLEAHEMQCFLMMHGPSLPPPQADVPIWGGQPPLLGPHGPPRPLPLDPCLLVVPVAALARAPLPPPTPLLFTASPFSSPTPRPTMALPWTQYCHHARPTHTPPPPTTGQKGPRCARQ